MIGSERLEISTILKTLGYTTLKTLHILLNYVGIINSIGYFTIIVYFL